MQQTIVKTYKGKQQQAMEAYQADAAKMARQGYAPTSQVWAPGSYGCGSFIFAALLCFIVIGFIVFIYMLIVKPAGTLTVTYTLAPKIDPEKVCPKCAENVKASATVCRFSGQKVDYLSSSTISVPTQLETSSRSTGAVDLGRKLGKMFAKKSGK
jgi:hypothetical protein